MLSDALVVIDLQNGVINAIQQDVAVEKLLEKVNRRIKLYRAQQRPVIFIQHNDEELVVDGSLWRLVPSLAAQPDDIYLQKTHANAFYSTHFADYLNENHISRFEICGAQTEYCIDATVKMAHGLGYQLQMLSGMTITGDNLYMTAVETVVFYENIWRNRFLTLIDETKVRE